MANRKRYSDEDRASLMVMLESKGYPNTLGALKEVAAYSGVHVRVLRRWWLGTQNPPPDNLVSLKKIDLAEAINQELNGIFESMKTARKDADYRALGTVAGILMDKKFLLEGKPTEHTEHSGAIILKTGMSMDDL
jgi:hypothetical protein